MLKIHLWLFSCLLGMFSVGQNVNLSGGLIFEGEPFIAQNPNDPNHLVVAWMGFKLGERVVIKTKSSFDGGNTWSEWTNLPHINSEHTSADPSLEFDGDGFVYVCYIDYDNVDKESGAVVVAKSLDGGLSWSSPVVAIDIAMCPDKLCIDRPWMAIDKSNGGLNGTIYVTSMNADEPEVVAPYNPNVAVSYDGGLSFDLFRQLDTINFLSGSLIRQPMPSPSVTADGRFVAIYPSYVPSQSVFARNILVSSTDGAVSLSHSIVNNVNQGFSESDTKKAPLLVTHPSNSDRMAFLFLSESQGDLDVFMMETLNGGTSWSSLLRVNDDPINNGVLQDMLWADYNQEGDLIVCWRDRRNGGMGFAVPSDIYASVKFNSAANFSTNFLVSDQTVPHDPILANPGNDFLSVVLSGDTAHVVWGDIRSGVLNIYYNKTSVSNPTNSIQIISSADWRFKDVYPNPTVNILNLDDQFVGGEYFIVSGTSGIVQTGFLNSEQLDVSNLSTGDYYIVIKLKNKDIGLKFIKQ